MAHMRRLLLALLLLLTLTVSVSAHSLVVERQVFEFLTEELGLPSSSACGILANIEHESDFDPLTLGDNGTSFGLCQWHNQRWTSLRAFCQARGLREETIQGQLQYLKHELETDYPQLLDTLRAMEDTPNGAYGAAYIWCVEFERPADMVNRGKSRGMLARGKYWNRYHNSLTQEQDADAPSQEEIRVVVRQGEVTIPQPPEPETGMETQQQDPKVGYFYLPQNIPEPAPMKVPDGMPPEQSVHTATAFACACLFIPFSDGRKQPFALPEPEYEEQSV